MSKLILLRHGASEWNDRNIFTGWVDIPLSQKGIEESLAAGKKMAEMPVDWIFASTLVRSQLTVMLAMAQHKSGKVPQILHPGEGNLESWAQIYSEKTKSQMIPVTIAWELNERMYGGAAGYEQR